MRKNIAITALIGLLAASTPAKADEGPHIYGLVNKEFRYLAQDGDLNLNEVTSVTDVDGFESRIGVKGKHDLDNMKAHYKIELGINSNLDNKNENSEERIRIRLAYVKLESTWGSFTIGQNWTPNTLRMLQLDPFTGTGAQALGLESSGFVDNVAGNYGIRALYFRDLLSYESMDIGGAKVHLTQSRESSNYTPSSETEETSLMLSYDRALGGLNLKSHFNYTIIEKEKTLSKNEEKFMTLGAHLGFENMGFGLALTDQNKGDNGLGKDVKFSHLLFGFHYSINNWTLGLNYGATDFGKDDSLIDGKQSQVSAGAIYKMSSNVKTRLIYKSMTREKESANITGLTKKSHTGSMLIAGITLSF